MRNLTLFALCLALFLLRASYGHERLVVFGDSLSDNGNTFAVSGVPGFPYFEGRYSNGPNWVDYFPGIAEQFRVDISPATAWLQDPTNSDIDTTDFAVGGSTSGNLNTINGKLPGFRDQIGAYLGRLGIGKAPAIQVIALGTARSLAISIGPCGLGVKRINRAIGGLK
jgi:phospholipase/lecithinase/hemolysin